MPRDKQTEEAQGKVAERVGRILALIPYIRSHPGISLTQLARYAGCSPKDLMRDLDRILMCGVPPYSPHDYVGVHVEGKRVTVGFADHFKRPVRLTLTEALALQVMLSTVGGGLRQAAVAEKIEAALGAGTKRKATQASKRIQVLAGYKPLAERLRVIEKAIADRRELAIEYYTASRDDMTQRNIRPYGLIEHQGWWYVIAFCRLRDRVLPFRVDRIKALKLTDDTFEIPDHFNLDAYTQTELYLPSRRDRAVEIKFDHEVARWVRENAPPADIKSLPDGGILLRVRASHMQWVIRWVLPFGPHAEIVGSLPARKAMTDLCDRMLRNYRARS